MKQKKPVAVLATPNVAPSHFLSIPAIAKELDVCLDTVRREIKEGRLRSCKIRNRRLVLRADLEAYKERIFNER